MLTQSGGAQLVLAPVGTVSVQAGPTVVSPSGNPDIDGILWGYRWSSTDLTYAFPTSAADYVGYPAITGFQAFSAVQQAAMLQILANYDHVSGLSLTPAPAGTTPNLRFAEATTLTYDSVDYGPTQVHNVGGIGSAESNPPDPTVVGSYAFGDSWFNRAESGSGDNYNNPTPGTYANSTLMHELGHALGLDHAMFSQHFGDVPFNHNSLEYTVMTYFTFPGNFFTGDRGTIGHPQTLMQDDIAALQYMYGADYAYNSTNTTYTWSATSGEMFVDGAPQGLATADGHIFLTVWDGGGIDTYDLSNYTTAQTIDLRPGAWTTAAQSQLAYLGINLGTPRLASGNIANALLYNDDPRNLIENAHGGSGNDAITGNNADNLLIGGTGADTLSGGAGNDTLIGDEPVTDQGTILSFDGSGFDATRVQDATVVKVGGSYKMFYGGLPFFNNYQIGLATSSDGATWTKSSADPVISNAQSQPWASFRELPSTVLYENGIYKLWFNGDNTNLETDPGRINGFGYATSADGVTWTFEASNPIRGEVNSPTTNGFELREVVKLGSQYHAYFIHRLTSGDILDHAASSDGVHFSNDAPVGIGNGYSLEAATTASYGGTDYVFSIWQKAGVHYYGTSLDGVNFTIRGTLAVPFNVDSILFDNGMIKFFGGKGVGNVNWDFGNSVIAYATMHGDLGTLLNVDDVLDGGTGADSMAGGAGNDTYFVDNAGDLVSENADDGTDTVKASISFVLPANVENLVLLPGAINGTGNGLNNLLTGNASNNILDGAAGIDGVDYSSTTSGVTVHLSFAQNQATGSEIGTDQLPNIENVLGGSGNDLLVGNSAANLLNGGPGADTLVGQSGDDSYFVDNTGDVVTENPGEGNDRVSASINYTLPANVEVLLLLEGAGPIAGYGTSSNDEIVGNSANNILDGKGGSDRMVGGLGNDIYYVDNIGDQVVENSGEGNDIVYATIDYTIEPNVNSVVLVEGAGNLNAAGNAAFNALIGNSGNNALDGKSGSDYMVGGPGNDIYYVDAAGDQVVENPNEGNDIVYASFDYTLGPNVDSVVLVEVAGNINAAGSSLVNALIGNSGNNNLDGKGGDDHMVGGAGNDIYYVDTAGDEVIENPNEGNDIVYASISYTIGPNVESVVLQGTGNLDAAGSSTDNALIGNSGNNNLDGKGGADYMVGGAGNDIYYVETPGDTVVENPGEGSNDIVHSTMNYTLPANVEALVLDGTANLAGTGNSAGNAIVGNSGNNTLDGKGDGDFLVGNAGNDTFRFQSGEAGGDVIADFDGTGASLGDSLVFSGYGTGPGATFTQVGSSNQWQIHSGLDGHDEFITLQNGASVNAADYSFV